MFFFVSVNLSWFPNTINTYNLSHWLGGYENKSNVQNVYVSLLSREDVKIVLIEMSSCFSEPSSTYKTDLCKLTLPQTNHKPCTIFSQNTKYQILSGLYQPCLTITCCSYLAKHFPCGMITCSNL